MPSVSVEGPIIRQLRVGLGLKQEDVAREAGVSTAFISRIEHGQRGVSTKVLTELARTLGVHRDVLMGDTPLTLTTQMIDVPIVIVAPGAPLDIVADVMDAVVEICRSRGLDAITRRPEPYGTMIVGRQVVPPSEN